MQTIDSNSLYRLAREKSAEERAALAEAMADLFHERRQRLTDREWALMTDILHRVVLDVEASIRRNISAWLADLPEVPRDLVRLRLPFRDVLFRLADRVGRERLCAVSALPLYTPDDGALAGMVGLLRDVTGQPWAEEETARLLRAVDGHMVMVAVVDADGRICYANRRLGELVGADPGALLARAFAELAVPDGPETWRLVRAQGLDMPVTAMSVPLGDRAEEACRLWGLCDEAVAGLYGGGASPSFDETLAGIAAAVRLVLTTAGLPALQGAGTMPRRAVPAWPKPGFAASKDAPQLRFSGRQQDVFALLIAGRSNAAAACRVRAARAPEDGA